MAAGGMTDELAERRMLRALRAGDADAYAELHRHYHRRMVGLAMAQGCGRESAHEVVQETWAAVVQNIHGFRGSCTLKTWIFRILINTASARVRSESRVVLLSAVTPEGEDGLLDHATEPAERVIQLDRVRRLRTAIDGLPLPQRRVIVLRDLRGWSSDEVCEELAISEANQRVLLHRARARVRQATG
jgi:RNA polymerase sigma-70 factor, ECF subfamily